MIKWQWALSVPLHQVELRVGGVSQSENLSCADANAKVELNAVQAGSSGPHCCRCRGEGGCLRALPHALITFAANLRKRAANAATWRVKFGVVRKYTLGRSVGNVF